MAKIRKRKIRWKPSTSSSVIGYKLYWSIDGELDYNSESADVGNVTEVILPDDIPSFPSSGRDVQLGIVAVSEMGNESDFTITSAPFEFVAPDPPKEPVLESMEEFFIYSPKPDNPGGLEIEEA